MASTSAFTYRSAKDLYDHIDAQFQLSSDQLIDLTKNFLHEFKLGLENYGHAMAMMYVHTYPSWIALIRIQTHFRDWCT